MRIAKIELYMEDDGVVTTMLSGSPATLLGMLEQAKHDVLLHREAKKEPNNGTKN